MRRGAVLDIIRRRRRKLISTFAFVGRECLLGDYVAVERFSKIRNSSIGSYTYVGAWTQVLNATIGRYCSIAHSVKVGLGRHPTDRFSTSPLFYSANNIFGIDTGVGTTFEEYRPITIMNDVWIGANAVVMDGVTLGNGCIIAAGAVVTRDVPDYAIVAGVPARVMRYRLAQRDIAMLLESKWWELDLEELIQYRESFHSLAEFVYNLSSYRKSQ